jgi:hypothetical protein
MIGSEVAAKFQQLVMLYKTEIPQIKARELQRKTLDQTVEQLRRGTHRGFEDYVADVFRNLEEISKMWSSRLKATTEALTSLPGTQRG